MRAGIMGGPYPWARKKENVCVRLADSSGSPQTKSPVFSMPQTGCGMLLRIRKVLLCANYTVIICAVSTQII